MNFSLAAYQTLFNIAIARARAAMWLAWLRFSAAHNFTALTINLVLFVVAVLTLVQLALSTTSVH